ncbi:MAG: SdiA-regulated domain-containing protein [Pseudomonadota bacterium]
MNQPTDRKSLKVTNGICATLTLVANTLVSATPLKAQTNMLELIESYKVADKSEGFFEPSGLSLSSVDGFLWSVSDEASKLHLLGVDGKLKSAFKIPEDLGTDLEGVAGRKDGSVLLLQETDRSIVMIQPTDPIKVNSTPISSLRGYDKIAARLAENPLNKGPEGITVDPDSGQIFLVIEGQPRLLLIISPDIDEVIEAIPLTAQTGFVSSRTDDDELDISGVAWSGKTRSLWILSDEGRRIFVFDPGVQTVKPIDLVYSKKDKVKEVKNPEGIALDESGGVLYIVTDDRKKSRLYAFVLPQVSFP